MADAVLLGNPEKPYVKFSTELKGHQASVEKIAWNPTKDAELCSVSSDGAVKFWDVRTKTCFNEVKGLEDAFTLVWAPDGQTLIVGNKVRHWYCFSCFLCSILTAWHSPINSSFFLRRLQHLFPPISKLIRRTR